MQSLSTTVKAPGAIDLVYFDVKFSMFCLNWVNKFSCFAFQNGKILDVRPAYVSFYICCSTGFYVSLYFLYIFSLSCGTG